MKDEASGIFGRVLCVVVTFNAGVSVVDTLASVCDLVYEPLDVLIIDNASSDGTPDRVRNAELGRPVQVSLLDENRGLAWAYNAALKQARVGGYRWLLLFDQDTTVPRDLMERFGDGYRGLPDGDRVAVLIPKSYNAYRPDTVLPPLRWQAGELVPVPTEELGGAPLRVGSANSSGSLLNVSLCSLAGGFREDLFIDFVDHEFNLRVGRQGGFIYCVPTAEVHHRLGFDREITGKDGTIVFREHPPYRYYYMIRNYVFCHRSLFGGSPSLPSLVRRVWDFSMTIMKYDGHPFRSLGYILRGFVDGIAGRLGPRVKPG